MKRLVALAVFASATLIVPAGSVLADNTGATGQPGAPNITCQTQPSSPGNAASNNGSPFSATGQSGNVYAGNPGTASAANANSTHAVSQYDIACFQVSH